MNMVHLTDDELRTAHEGMTAFLHDFSHDEADTVLAIRSVLAKLAAAQPEKETTATVG